MSQIGYVMEIRCHVSIEILFLDNKTAFVYKLYKGLTRDLEFVLSNTKLHRCNASLSSNTLLAS